LCNLLWINGCDGAYAENYQSGFEFRMSAEKRRGNAAVRRAARMASLVIANLYDIVIDDAA
jgi:hypothetical protein